MKAFVKSMNKLPWIVKLILCIPVFEIVWSVTRLVDGIARKNVLKIVLSILTIVPGAAFMWLVDLIWVIIYKRAFWL